MNKVALEKLITKLVLDRYSWIEDYKIDVYIDKPIEKYTFIYYVKPELDGTFTVDNEFMEIEKLTETLFTMLGPEHYQWFNGVEFKVKMNR